MNDDIGPVDQRMLESLQRSRMSALDLHDAMRNLSKSFELARPRLRAFGVLNDQSPDYVIEEEP